MGRETELTLLDQVLGQIARGVPDMAASSGTAPVAHYLDPRRFDEERASVFSQFPIALAHRDEIAQPGEYLVREVAGKSIIVIRGADGRARAFLNACRHRGAQLLGAPNGHVRALVWPYHAWTYRPDGTLFRRAAQAAVLIEPGDVFFAEPRPANHFRLGHQSIPANLIEAGIRVLADAISKQQAGR